ncbi:MAG: exosortase family protein XrtF [Cyclobacteriaceae bacterium]|nr:exosortase family protein XrtF [Cyclobacteriaceae bacterium]
MSKQINTLTIQLFREYKPSIFFLLRFLGVYILGNIAYGLWVVSFGLIADSFTLMVADHSASLLNLIGLITTVEPSAILPNASLMHNGQVVVNVYEGCNAINVSILFVAFLCAYKGSLNRTLVFSLVGLVSIYLFNLLRVGGLFLVALYFPNHLYLMHKFVFTGVIYAFVFGLWFIWVTKINPAAGRP